MELLRCLISLDVKSAHDAVSLETDWHYRSLGDFGYGPDDFGYISLCDQGVNVTPVNILPWHGSRTRHAIAEEPVILWARHPAANTRGPY